MSIDVEILKILKSYSSIIDFNDSKEATNLVADIVSLFKEQLKTNLQEIGDNINKPKFMFG